MAESEMEVESGGGRVERVIVNYPGNSNKAKAAQAAKDEAAENGNLTNRPRPTPVVTGEARTRKRGFAARSGIIGDSAQNVGHYLASDVLLPALKSLVSDIVSQGVDRLLFGDSRPRQSTGSRPGYTSYNRISTTTTRPTEYGGREISRRARAVHDFDEIILATRAEAEDVLTALRDIVDKFECATIVDLYDLVDITGSFTDNKWGWYAEDLRRVGISRIRDGFVLDLPKPQALER
jgi:hypothetical protein